ncbi:MAG: 3-methyl-2-oxobutanoate dehydrogenase subunit VorB, partial [Bacillota bacterium]|nr:3-methyl-2-oxobutanoate dehydrogenase subunit VorB [Bacillota bacterium]
AGALVMTSSSSPGISLKQEGISYLAGAELPCVIVNMVRGGPGLGDIQPAQSDYFQATKGGGHGDYHLLVLAPSSIQELVDLAFQAFDLADRYRNPVLILGDGMLGQMMEPVVLPPFRTDPLPPKPWATTGAGKGPRRVINSLYMDPARLEEHNWHLVEKYRAMEREVRWEEVGTDGAEVVLVAYGTAARVAKAAAAQATALGIKTGLLRPLTLFPFPYEAVRRLAGQVRLLLVVELSAGQMVEDVRLGAEGRCPVRLYGRPGGQVPTPQDVVEAIQRERGQ